MNFVGAFVSIQSSRIHELNNDFFKFNAFINCGKTSQDKHLQFFFWSGFLVRCVGVLFCYASGESFIQLNAMLTVFSSNENLGIQDYSRINSKFDSDNAINRDFLRAI